jgi:uncharacterized damage-inducible protein DinB
MSRARYHHWANVQLNDFLLEADRNGAFVGRADLREKVCDALAHTMAVDCLWLDRLEGSEQPCEGERRFAVLDLPEMLKARSLLDARLMAAVQRLGPAAQDETVEASNGLRIGLPSVVRFMLARNQRLRSKIAGFLTELNLTPPLMGVQLFETHMQPRAPRHEVRQYVSPGVDSRLLAAVG